MVSVVVPTYNESENLPRVINSIGEALKEIDFKVIVVDDNSTDGTATTAKKLSQRYKNIIVCQRPRKRGLGSAIRKGMEIALSFKNTAYIVTIDADLQHSPKEIVRLLRETENADLVVGSRYVKGAKIIEWNGLRKLMSTFANALCQLLFKTSLHDHTTNFRVYSRKCSETLMETLNNNGLEWQVLSILAAKKHKYRIKEVPITFKRRLNGKTKLAPLDVIRWVFSILKFNFGTFASTELCLQPTATSTVWTELKHT